MILQQIISSADNYEKEVMFHLLLSLLIHFCPVPRGVVVVDVKLDELDINQCPMDFHVPNAFKDTSRCHFENTYVSLQNNMFVCLLTYNQVFLDHTAIFTRQKLDNTQLNY